MENAIETAEQSTGVAQTTTKTKKPTSSAKPSKNANAMKRTKSAAKKSAKHPAEHTNKKADVIALMRRAKGATLTEIMKETSWQGHTVRGFVSILGKNGEKIDSSKNDADERTYRIVK